MVLHLLPSYELLVSARLQLSEVHRLVFIDDLALLGDRDCSQSMVSCRHNALNACVFEVIYCLVSLLLNLINEDEQT